MVHELTQYLTRDDGSLRFLLDLDKSADGKVIPRPVPGPGLSRVCAIAPSLVCKALRVAGLYGLAGHWCVWPVVSLVGGACGVCPGSKILGTFEAACTPPWQES